MVEGIIILFVLNLLWWSGFGDIMYVGIGIWVWWIDRIELNMEMFVV